MKIVKFIFTFLLQILLIIIELTLGIMLFAQKITSQEGLSQNIQEIEMERLLVDEKGNQTKVGKQVYDLLQYANISKSDANIIINDNTFKAVISDFISSATLHQVDNKVEIKYPSEKDITNIIYNNFDYLKDSYQININKEDITKERIQEEVSKNYKNIRNKLQEFAESLGE